MTKTTNEAINFRINSEMIANLKRLAQHVSNELNDDYTYVDIIRCLLADNFPVFDVDVTPEEQKEKAVEMCLKIPKSAAILGVAEIPVMFTSSTIQGVTSTRAYNLTSTVDDKPHQE